MIDKPYNWDEVKEFIDKPKLPLDAYVCKVKKAVIKSTDYGDLLCLLIDIAEGEFKGFYEDDFANNQNEDKKWKGVLRQWLPKDDKSEKDEWTKRSLKGMITSFEKSNAGYQFNWNEKSLEGKLIGVLFRNEEWEYNNQTGWAVRPFKAISVDSVRSGNFRLPKDKELQNKTDNVAADISSYNNGFTAVVEEDLPF